MREPRDRRASRRVLLRRFLVVFAVALWQGGFLFYALVVVPVGTQVLGSAAAQGAITRKVTGWLNLIGLAVLFLLAWELALSHPRSSRITRRWRVWAVLLVCQYLLFFLHAVLEYFLGGDPRPVGFIRPFHQIHAAYLWVSTVMWVGTLILIWMLLKSWATTDGEKGYMRRS